MRIVSWNCSGPPRIKRASLARSWFREAFFQVEPFKADIVVLQEVANPSTEVFRGQSIFWHGSTMARGVAVILDQAKFPKARLVAATRSSVLVDTGAPHHFLVLGVWSRPEKPSLGGYLLETKAALDDHREHLLHSPGVVVGHLRSNACWDSRTRVFSHSQLMALLATDFGLHSAYHSQHLAHPGEETDATSCSRKSPCKRLHVDYAFLPASWLLEGVNVGRTPDYLSDNDHYPLIVDCRRSDRSLPADLTRVEDVEIGFRTGEALSFHLQSTSAGWRHGYDAALDLLNLNASLTMSGVHDLLTCACGLALCRCGVPRRRGVRVSVLADGDAVWHDRDRDFWYRLSRHRLRHQLAGLAARCKAVRQEFSTGSGIPIHPYRSQMYLSQCDSGTPQPRGEYDPPSESALTARAYFPDLPDNDVATEIREFVRWIDDERVVPLGTRFVPFAEGLLKMLPEVLALPRLERLVLVLAGATHHMDAPDGSWHLKGFEKLRALLGDIDLVWGPLLQARLPGHFEPDALPARTDVRLPLLARLLRLGELLAVSEHRPRLPMPRELFEPNEVLVETEDPERPYEVITTPFDRDGYAEFWKRAYTKEVVRTGDGSLRVIFAVPASAADQYTEYLVLPRIQELSQLLEPIREQFLASGLAVGPLLHEVESDETMPRMPNLCEALFGMNPVDGLSRGEGGHALPKGLGGPLANLANP